MSDLTPSVQEHDLITLTEAATLTGLSRATLWRRYRAGRLQPATAPNPHSDRAHRLLFHRADVLALEPKRPDKAPRLLAEPPGDYDPRGGE